MILTDLEPQKWIFSEYFLPFLDAAHISILNCDEMAGEPEQDNLCMNFAALKVDFSSPSPDPLGSRIVSKVRPITSSSKQNYGGVLYKNNYTVRRFTDDTQTEIFISPIVQVKTAII